MYQPDQHLNLVSDSSLIRSAEQYRSFLALLEGQDGSHKLDDIKEIKRQLEAVENELQRRGIDPDQFVGDGNM